MNLVQIVKALKNLHDRNKRVEAEKAWETSWTRRLWIALITFTVAACWLIVIGESLPWAKALIPTFGYILSTLTLPMVKRRWIERYGKE